MINALFIAADTGGCGFYRMYSPAFWLTKLGLMNCHMHVARLEADADGQPAWDWPDVVIFQRYRNPTDAVWWEFHRRGKPIIAENDDRYDVVPPHSCWKKPFPRHEVLGIEKAMVLADAVFTTTPELADHWKPLNENTFVLPNSLDTRIQPSQLGDDGKIRIGWTASPHHAVDWRIVSHALKEIAAEDPRVVLSFLGWKPPLEKEKIISKNRVEHEGWQKLQTYYSAARMRKWDVGIAPLTPCEFNDAKSELKVLEYGLLGVPCVASPAAPYRRLADAGAPHMALARNHRQWVSQLRRLVKDAELRKSLGNAGRDFVEKNYSIQKNVTRWAEAIEKVVSGPRNPKREAAFRNMEAHIR